MIEEDDDRTTFTISDDQLAHSIRVFTCDHCSGIHLAFLDEDREIIGMAVMDADEATRMSQSIMNAIGVMEQAGRGGMN